jgi:hypothetical protein
MSAISEVDEALRDEELVITASGCILHEPGEPRFGKDQHHDASRYGMSVMFVSVRIIKSGRTPIASGLGTNTVSK